MGQRAATKPHLQGFTRLNAAELAAARKARESCLEPIESQKSHELVATERADEKALFRISAATSTSVVVANPSSRQWKAHRSTAKCVRLA